jgi:hypothetical protein
VFVAIDELMRFVRCGDNWFIPALTIFIVMGSSPHEFDPLNCFKSVTTLSFVAYFMLNLALVCGLVS